MVRKEIVLFGFASFLLFLPGIGKGVENTLDFSLKLEQGQIMEGGAVSGWVKVTNLSGTEVIISGGLYETEAPWSFVLDYGGEIKLVGGNDRKRDLVSTVRIAPHCSVFKPILVYSDYRGLVFDRQGEWRFGIETTIEYSQNGGAKNYQKCKTHMFSIHVILPGKGYLEFQNRYKLSFLGYVALSGASLDDGFEEKYLDYGPVHATIAVYGMGVGALTSFFRSGGSTWMGKNKGYKFSTLIEDGKRTSLECGVGGWLWSAIEKEFKEIKINGPKDVGVNNMQLGDIFIDH